ncbi:MAG: amidohydrolase [Bacillota bacterium]|jgi:imidazolonepropionase-like amidohydrolase
MLAVINARIETVANGIIENGQMLVENGKIKAIGQNLTIPAEAKIIDAAGRTVTPGIVEGHAHIGIGEQGVGPAGQDTNEATNPVTAWCNALDGINMRDSAFDDFRRAGITSVNVPPGSANIIGGTTVALKCKGTIVDEAVIRNPVAMKAALGENPKNAYGGRRRMAPSTRMGNAAVMREALLKAQQYLTKLDNAKSEQDKPRYDKQCEALLPVMRGEIPMMIHCHRADDIATAIRVANEFGIRYVLDHVTDGFLVADLLKKHNVSCAVGPTMQYGSKVENRERDFRTAIELDRAGVHFSFTTDHAVVAGQYLITTAALAVGWGLDRDRALRAITLAPAEHVGIADRVGSLEVGKDADFVVWSGDPLEFTTFADITVIDGEIVYEREGQACC